MNVTDYLKIVDLFEGMKRNTRHSWLSDGRHESVAEHSWRLAAMAYFVRDEFPEADWAKVMLMCIFHDVGEAFTGDIPAFLKTDVDKETEESVVDQFLSSLPEPYQRDLKSLFEEMGQLKTTESKIYKALDRMEAVIQHNEANISTWLPLEYDLQLTYGEKEVAFSPYMQELKKAANKRSLEKISEKESGKGSEPFR